MIFNLGFDGMPLFQISTGSYKDRNRWETRESAFEERRFLFPSFKNSKRGERKDFARLLKALYMFLRHPLGSRGPGCRDLRLPFRAHIPGSSSASENIYCTSRPLSF